MACGLPGPIKINDDRISPYMGWFPSHDGLKKNLSAWLLQAINMEIG